MVERPVSESPFPLASQPTSLCGLPKGARPTASIPKTMQTQIRIGINAPALSSGTLPFGGWLSRTSSLGPSAGLTLKKLLDISRRDQVGESVAFKMIGKTPAE